MKRIVIIAALLLGYTGLKAQDCEAIMLPYFKNNRAQMEGYRTHAPEKFAYRCTFAAAAFYESDTVPAGAEMVSLTEVKNLQDGQSLTAGYVVDINTLSYYAFNFNLIQGRFPGREICFATPASRHGYLVLRTRDEMEKAASYVINN